MIALFLREAAGAVAGRAKQCETYCIEEEAKALLCAFDYPGNIRALRNLIYELTSYMGESELISIELVRFVLVRLNSRGSNLVTGTNGERQGGSSPPGIQLIPVGKASSMDAAAQHSLVRSIAGEGDIIFAARTLRVASRRNLQAMDRAREALQHSSGAHCDRWKSTKRGQEIGPHPK
jgi:DNA-binding NtrC family response regulator